jgi:hypothetical protein
MSTKTKAKHTKKPPDGLTPISARKINLLQGVSAEDIQLLGAALALGLAAGTERAKGRTQGETHTRTVWVMAETAEKAANLENHVGWIFGSAEEVWKMIREPNHALRCYECRPFQVTVTITDSEAPLTKAEVDELTRLHKQAFPEDK